MPKFRISVAPTINRLLGIPSEGSEEQLQKRKLLKDTTRVTAAITGLLASTIGKEWFRDSTSEILQKFTKELDKNFPNQYLVSFIRRIPIDIKGISNRHDVVVAVDHRPQKPHASSVTVSIDSDIEVQNYGQIDQLSQDKAAALVLSLDGDPSLKSTTEDSELIYGSLAESKKYADMYKNLGNGIEVRPRAAFSIEKDQNALEFNTVDNNPTPVIGTRLDISPGDFKRIRFELLVFVDGENYMTSVTYSRGSNDKEYIQQGTGSGGLIPAGNKIKAAGVDSILTPEAIANLESQIAELLSRAQNPKSPLLQLAQMMCTRFNKPEAFQQFNSTVRNEIPMMMDQLDLTKTDIARQLMTTLEFSFY